jgi:hypothetical protein
MPFEIVIIVALGVSAGLLSPLVRAYARRMESRIAPARVPADVDARLQRMEQAIDAIAVEVERIAEGQRFTSKLLASRADVRRPDGALARTTD